MIVLGTRMLHTKHYITTVSKQCIHEDTALMVDMVTLGMNMCVSTQALESHTYCNLHDVFFRMLRMYQLVNERRD